MQSVNPATGQVLGTYREHGAGEVEAALSKAVAAFELWRDMPIGERATLVAAAGNRLRVRRAELAELITREMGKPIAESEAEVEKCAAACEYFAGHGAAMLSREDALSDAMRSYVRYDPLGPVLAIMPWNFPFWQVFRFAAPGLLAGNVGLLKHASNVCGCALAIEDVFREAGLPAGAFTTLLISGKRAESLIAHPAVRAVTLTGSEQAGRAVGAAAGSALKKSVLELGGSDPFIVLEDADIEATAEAAASARCINSGQSCIAAKRFIVLEAVAGRFESAFAERMRKLPVGDPMDRGTRVGPLAREDLRDDLHRQVVETAAAGAKVLVGGKVRSGRGYYYEPTVLGNVRPGMRAFDEETFGPVGAVIRAKDVEEAVALANRSAYGLGASVWTRDLERAEGLARRIESGCVFVNGPVKSDPRLPFGGVKNSGYGRELAEVGIREFVNLKTVWVKGHPEAGPGRVTE